MFERLLIVSDGGFKINVEIENLFRQNATMYNIGAAKYSAVSRRERTTTKCSNNKVA